MAADDRAIVVGISHYPALGDLAGPENDARAFAAWLTLASEGDVPEDNIDLILSSDFPQGKGAVRAKPTAEAVKEAIDNLHEIGENNNGHVGRRLYLFMAGHGLAVGARDAALLMANAAKKRTGHHVPGGPYADWFCQSAFFEEVVLLMDCCLEDNKLSPVQPCHLDPVSPSDHKRARYFYAMAAELNRPAREIPDGKGQVRGVFTTAILVGLRQGPPGGGDVTGAWLEDYVPQHMTRLLGQTEHQSPLFEYQRHHDITFVKRSAANYLVRIDTNPAGRNRTVEMRDGKLVVIPSSSQFNGVWEWNLSPGLYSYRYIDGEPRFLEVAGEGKMINAPI